MGQTTPDPDEHVFNDDLLIHKDDPKFARKQFPKISHILDDPSLKEEFVKYEKAANAARERVRFFGFTAVAASTVALVALATRSLWPHTQWARLLAAVIELGGMLGAIVAAGGLWFGSSKRQWLESRLMTERLRQWHFQLMIRRGQQIEASYDKGLGAIEAFQKQRDHWFAQFLKDYQGKLDNRLESAINDTILSVVWLHDPTSPYGANSSALHEIFEAYERLRFDHQYGYAVFKLKTTTDKPFRQFLKWPPSVQRAVLSSASSSCFIGALICSAILIWGDLFTLSDQLELYLRTVAIVIAVIGVALRTVQEGLGLEGEIERYREYRERIALLHDRFKQTLDQNQRLRLMEELELASVEEMQDFMRIHQTAKFLLA